MRLDNAGMQQVDVSSGNCSQVMDDEIAFENAKSPREMVTSMPMQM